MKWILASTTALALTMGAAQVGFAQDSTEPSATETPPATQDSNDTLMNNQPVTPETGTTATETAPTADPDLDVTMEDSALPTGSDLSAREIVGAEVMGPDGNSVGVVDDLVLDASGKIEHVIIADGGILGLGGKQVAVKYAGATLAREADGSDPVVRVNMTEESLDAAAEFDKEGLEEQGDRLASSYIERDVRLAAGDSMGEINDLLLDQSGTAKFAVIEFGGIMDIGDNEVAVAFDKLSDAPEGEPMTVSMTEEELKAAAKIDGEAIDPAMTDPAATAPAN